MKIAIFSESPADEAAIRILVEAILQRPTVRVEVFELRSRGWPSVRQVLPSIIKHLYYRTDAEALVIVADSNGSEVHRIEHVSEGPCSEHCRLCLLRNAAAQALQNLGAVHGRGRLRVAIGLAIPAIEAWFCCGHMPGVNEAVWKQGLETNARAMPYYRPHLKQHLYGTDRPSLQQETQIMVEHARRLTTMIPRLCEAFPIGFGGLRDDIAKW